MGKSERWARLLLKRQAEAPDQCLTRCIYLDKAVPGNNQRPDHGRAFQCIYFTILELPDWLRSRRSGWIPCCYMLVVDQEESEIRDTQLLRFVVNRFYDSSKQEQLERGLPVDSMFGPVQIRLQVRLTLGD